MSWLQDYGVVFDAAIILLLVVTIGYATVLNRKLSLLRQARGEMEKVIADFAAATDQAQSGLKALQEGSGEASGALARNVSDACRLADEMAFLVKKGNEIADRLEVAISASRKAAPAAGPLPAAAAAPLPQAPTARPQSAAEADAAAAARGIAKLAKRRLSGTDSELMRTLQAMR
ncbi:MAG TPA: DUF6468 domain-containing protein [Kiloniellaceae bacterium]|nr:DUF6468 domain-containing protein [Kiloniellaceae bacterium]